MPSSAYLLHIYLGHLVALCAACVRQARRRHGPCPGGGVRPLYAERTLSRPGDESESSPSQRPRALRRDARPHRDSHAPVISESRRVAAAARRHRPQRRRGTPGRAPAAAGCAWARASRRVSAPSALQERRRSSDTPRPRAARRGGARARRTTEAESRRAIIRATSGHCPLPAPRAPQQLPLPLSLCLVPSRSNSCSLSLSLSLGVSGRHEHCSLPTTPAPPSPQHHTQTQTHLAGKQVHAYQLHTKNSHVSNCFACIFYQSAEVTFNLHIISSRSDSIRHFHFFRWMKVGDLILSPTLMSQMILHKIEFYQSTEVTLNLHNFSS
jgi:hypothetical protein